jgi:hypothetical protein
MGDTPLCEDMLCFVQRFQIAARAWALIQSSDLASRVSAIWNCLSAMPQVHSDRDGVVICEVVTSLALGVLERRDPLYAHHKHDVSATASSSRTHLPDYRDRGLSPVTYHACLPTNPDTTSMR